MATSTKTPTERLDAFSAWVFGDDGADAQLKAMREFLPQLREQLADLIARILPTVAECDDLSAELGTLYDHYALVRDTARETRNSLGEINDEMREIAAQLVPMEAQARLDAFGINEVTGKPFTVKQTDDRAVVALAKNDDYKALSARRRKLERQKAGAQAVLTDCDAALSEYRNRNRAMRARLDNLTARLGK